MSLELGKNDKGHPLTKRIITTYRGSLKPPPQFTKEFDATDVYDGKDHIWPVKQPEPDEGVVEIRDLTSFQIRYLWGENDGDDLDTSTFFTNIPDNAVNYKKVGFKQGNSAVAPYIYWGGDNTVSGAECIMLNIEALVEDYPELPPIIEAVIGARWFGKRGSGNVRLEINAYKGGTIVKGWQLLNRRNSSIAVDGIYLFPEQDGTIYIRNERTNELEKCWYGEAVKLKYKGEEIYLKINPIDDSIIGLPEDVDISIDRVSPYPDTHKYESGWIVPIDSDSGKPSYKIWNRQINPGTTEIVYYDYKIPIKTLITRVIGKDAPMATYHSVLLNSRGTREGLEDYSLDQASPSGYGFIAGNSEYKGRYYLDINIPKVSEETSLNPYLIGYLRYNIKTKVLTIEAFDGIGSVKVNDIINQEDREED